MIIELPIMAAAVRLGIPLHKNSDTRFSGNDCNTLECSSVGVAANNAIECQVGIRNMTPSRWIVGPMKLLDVQNPLAANFEVTVTIS